MQKFFEIFCKKVLTKQRFKCYINPALVKYPAVVVTYAKLGLLVVCIDALTHYVRCAEVHRCALYGSYFACRDRHIVNRCVPVSIDGDDIVVYGRGWVGYARKTEKAVVCHVDDSLLVGTSLIVDDEFVFVS